MTERQKLIARKRDLQAARNCVRKLEGVEALGVFELTENSALQQFCQAHFPAFFNRQPVSRLDYQASEEQVCVWLMEHLGLSGGDVCFWQIYSVWASIRILDLPAALGSLWAHRDILLITADFRQILGAGFDSRDEEHFLIDRLAVENEPEEDLHERGLL